MNRLQLVSSQLINVQLGQSRNWCGSLLRALLKLEEGGGFLNVKF